MLEMKRVEFVCQQCGEVSEVYRMKKEQPKKFCESCLIQRGYDQKREKKLKESVV